jgi:hypothetical protein
VALIVWLPGLKLEVLKEALPLLRGIWARAFDPSWNVTIPVGAVDPPVTVAVNKTDWPMAEGLGAEVSAVVVAKAWTFWRSNALPAGKFESPL